ncbi:MAG: hypothetical protein WCX48_05580 [Bacteroidales bacterium]
MKTKIKFFLPLFCLVILLFSCDRPLCKNTNPVFDKYSPDSEEYKSELVQQLGIVDKTKLSYWFSEYVESAGKELLYFRIQGDGLCAKIVLNVDQWNKLDELRQKKGETFRGAEFVNLKFEIVQDSLKTEFKYINFDRIID